MSIAFLDYKMVLVALIFTTFDIVTGLVASWVTGTFKSSVMREGGKHKLLLLMAIIFGVLLDAAQALVDLGFYIPATTAICSYITLMEIMSCVENINKGFPNALPKLVRNMLASAAKEAGIENVSAEADKNNKSDKKKTK